MFILRIVLHQQERPKAVVHRSALCCSAATPKQALGMIRGNLIASMAVVRDFADIHGNREFILRLGRFGRGGKAAVRCISAYPKADIGILSLQNFFYLDINNMMFRSDFASV